MENIKNTMNKGRLILKNVTPSQKQMLLSGSLGISALGIGSALGSHFPMSSGPEQPLPETEEICEDYCVEAEVPFCNVNTDNLNFTEAFQIARKEIGAGGFFEWNGQTYNTYYKEEWDVMTTQDKEEYWAAIENQTDTTTLTTLAQSGSTGTVLPATEEVDMTSDIGTEEPIFTFGYDDLSKDGLLDTVAVDQNGDGFADIVSLFEDGKEFMVVDTDFNNSYDLFVVKNIETGEQYQKPLELEDQDHVYDMDHFMSEDEAGDFIENHHDNVSLESEDQTLQDDFEYHNI